MARVVSCGVLLVNRHGALFACHATGTPRWDLPKGVAEPGETPRAAAVREAWEEAGLKLPADQLLDLGEQAYLPAKRLHLFALRVADGGIDTARCRCRSFFPHHRTGIATPEADAWSWKPRTEAPTWAAGSMARVLASLPWAQIDALPEMPRIELDT